MTTPLTPGVYVREAPGGAKSIESAPTAVTIFVGETERGPIGPTRVTSFTQFQRFFGGFRRLDSTNDTARLFMPYAVSGFFANGGPAAYILRLVNGTQTPAELDKTELDKITNPEAQAASVLALADRDLADGVQNSTPNDDTVISSLDSAITGLDAAILASPDVATLSAARLAIDNVDPSAADTEEIKDHVRDALVHIEAAMKILDLVADPPSFNLISASPGMTGDHIRVAVTSSTDGDPDRFNLHIFYQQPGQTSYTEVELFEGLSVDPLDEKYVADQLKRSLFINLDPDVVEDLSRPANFGDPDATPPGVPLTGGAGGNVTFPLSDYAEELTRLDRTEDAALIVCASDGLLNDDANHNNYINEVLGYVEARPQRDLFLVADAPRSTAALDPVSDAVNAARNLITPSNHLGLYWPHITVNDPIGLGRSPLINIPAAGHIAGLYGRTDARRGVWKVAAGVEASITGTVGLDFQILDQHQDQMNPHGLNAIRPIPGAGRVVWGGRTRQPTTEWRYVNVRRTAMFLRKSIFNGIQWAVFEGNDETLWAALRETVGSFMDAQFRNGAFAGETSSEAYFVKCDADTTTPDDQAAGIVNVQVGFAPLRPAEFVIVTLAQKTST